jgi:hypothetical protein
MIDDGKRADFHKWNDKNDKELTDGEKADGLGKLGSFFENRGYTSGKV